MRFCPNTGLVYAAHWNPREKGQLNVDIGQRLQALSFAGDTVLLINLSGQS